MIRISNRKIISSVAGVIYEMHPYHLPEDFNVIINKFEEYFHSIKEDTFVLCEFENKKALYKWLKEFLMDIEEFKNLNISRKLKDEGVKDTNDMRNSGIYFTSRYDKTELDTRYNDFIDLDACIRNIYNEILIKESLDHDCFLCEHAEYYGSCNPSPSKICEICINNPKYTDNHKPHPMSLKPHNEWTEEEKKLYELN